MFGLRNNGSKVHDFRFCENQKVINHLLKSLVLYEIQNADIECRIYLDVGSNKKWELYEHDDFETYRKPYLKGLRQYPHPSLVQTIETVCDSEYDDEIQGACRFLLEKECQGVEFREQLLDEIENRQLNKNKPRYNIIFESAELDNQTNMRDPLNKKIDIVNADHRHYLDLAKRALKLKNQV